MTRARRAAALAAALSFTMLLGACRPAATGSDSTAAASDGKVSAETAAAIAAAKAEVAAVSAVRTRIYVTEPLGASVAGKKLVYAEPAIPIGAIVGDKLEEAAKVIGFGFSRVSIGADPASIAAGMDQIAALAPDAVIVTAFDPASTWKTQALKLKARNIPTILIGGIACDDILSACQPDEVGVSLALVGGAAAVEMGRLQAAKVIVDSNGKANAAYFGDEMLGNSRFLEKGFVDRVKECPGCKARAQQLPSAGIQSGAAASQIVSFLQANPEVNYASLQYGDFATGVPTALKAAGLTGFHFVTQASGPAQYDDIKAGGSQIADVPVPLGYLGYLAVDSAARFVVGRKVTAEQVRQPMTVFTRDFIDVSDGGFWPGVEGYRDQFTLLWNVR